VECVPVLVLGHGGEQLELLRAFEMGADDFIVREHYSYLELRARLKVLLRRGACRCPPRPMCVGALEIDASSRQVRAAGAPVALSRLEYELLVQLARDPRRVCSKQELLGAVWGLAVSADTRTVDSHASRLRRKLEAAGAKGFVVNVWSVGYRLI
jgi:DNA-binding response OmpR family regulator